MDDWLVLFRRAMTVMDAVPAGVMPSDWTIGGGTMLFRRFAHRISRDIDIFLPNPQILVAISPRLNDAAARATDRAGGSYVEQSNFVKLTFADGDVDFIVAPHLLQPFATREDIDGRLVWVETPAEILAKKVLYRAADFTARDVFDLAFLIEQGAAHSLLADPGAFARPLRMVLARIEAAGPALRTAFAMIDSRAFNPSWDEATAIIRPFIASV